MLQLVHTFDSEAGRHPLHPLLRAGFLASLLLWLIRLWTFYVLIR
jgi:hypothetical protein